MFLVAGTVSGILANSIRPAEFIYDNIMSHATVVHAAHTFGVQKLLYLGSSCIYQRLAPQPMTKAELLTSALEPTDEPYAVAKLADPICDTVHPSAEIRYDPSKPDGSPRKLLDVSRLHNLGWRHKIELRRDIEVSYQWFCSTRTMRAWGRGETLLRSAVDLPVDRSDRRYDFLDVAVGRSGRAGSCRRRGLTAAEGKPISG